MRFRIALVRGPSSSCGLSCIPTKANNAENRALQERIFGTISGPGRWDSDHTQVKLDHLSAYKVACFGQEVDLDKHDQARNAA
jgi:hypothetical protein